MFPRIQKIFPFHILKRLFDMEERGHERNIQVDSLVNHTFEKYFKSIIASYTEKSSDYLNQVEDHINDFKTQIKGDSTNNTSVVYSTAEQSN